MTMQWIMISSTGVELGVVPGDSMYQAAMLASKRNISDFDHLHMVGAQQDCETCQSFKDAEKNSLEPRVIWIDWVSKNKYAEASGHKGTWMAAFEIGRQVGLKQSAMEALENGRNTTEAEAGSEAGADGILSEDQSAGVRNRSETRVKRAPRN